MRFRSSMLSDTILLTFAHIFLRAVSMAFQAYLSASIGAGGLGLLQLVLSAGSFAVTLGISGIRTATIYVCAEKFGKKQRFALSAALRVCLGYGLLCSLVASTLLWLFSSAISEMFLKIVGAEIPLSHFAFGIPFVVCSAVLSGFFTACKQIKKLVAVEIFDRIFSCFSVFCLLRLQQGQGTVPAVTACIDGGTISTAFSFFILLRMAWPHVFAAKCSKTSQIRKQVVSVSVPLALSDYLRSGLSSIEHLLIPVGLSRHLGSAEASLSEYGRLHGMVFPLMMFPAVVVQSLSELLMPELSRLTAQKNGFGTARLVKKCVRLGFFYSAAVAYLLYALSRQLVTLVYHDASLAILLRIFAPMVLILYADGVIDAMCKGLGKHVACVRISIFTSFLAVAALLLLLPRWGLRGYIAAFAMEHLVNFFLSMRLLLKTAAWTPSLLSALKCAFCVAVSAAACLAVPKMLPQGLYCILFCTAFFACYVYALRKLKVMRKTELAGFCLH